MTTPKVDAVTALLTAGEEIRRIANALEAVDLPLPARTDLATLIGELRYRAFSCISLAAERLAPGAGEGAPISRRRAGAG